MAKKPAPKKSQPKASKPDPVMERLNLICQVLDRIEQELRNKDEPEEDSPDTPDEAA